MQLLHFLRFATKGAATCPAPTKGLRYFARYSHSSPCIAAIVELNRSAYFFLYDPGLFSWFCDEGEPIAMLVRLAR